MASSSAQQTAALQMVADLEIEMMTDMYRRMTKSCQEKCVDTHYREAELSKGESVCLDRCVSKYLDVHDRLGRWRVYRWDRDKFNATAREWTQKYAM
uniref:Mitochondrial import inner membrane translocase subunit n=1 Tax=Globodera pallida TaxID=36090 RepID=A0A183C2Q8_GLOPA